MPVFDWISDADLDAATEAFVASIARCKDEQSSRLRRNVLDPFSLISIAHVFAAQTPNDVLDYAGTSAVIGCIGNALGKFHQEVLGSAKGWRNHDRGFDIICDRRKLLAEVKNKHNTMNAANRRQVEDDLRVALRQRESGWTGYLAIIIPRKPERYRTGLASNLFEVDGATFYKIVSGQDDSMHDVLHHLCETLGVTAAVADAVEELGSLPPRLQSP